MLYPYALLASLIMLSHGGALAVDEPGSYGVTVPLETQTEAALTPAEPTVIPGTEAIELGDPDASVGCLLVHGFAGSRRDFADLGDELAAAGCHVRLARLPGHGTTPEDMEAQSPDDLLEGARQELQSFRSNHEQIVLVGFSMGGVLSTLLAAEQPVDRLVLIAPAFEIQHQWYYGLRPEEWNRLLSPMVRWVPKGQATVQVNRKEARPNLFSYPRIPTRAVLVLAELGERARQPDLLAAVQMPLILLHSPGDFAASQAASLAAFPLLGSQDKRYVTMDERNNHHLLWDWDRAMAKEEILAFLAPVLAPLEE